MLVPADSMMVSDLDPELRGRMLDTMLVLVERIEDHTHSLCGRASSTTAEELYSEVERTVLQFAVGVLHRNHLAKVYDALPDEEKPLTADGESTALHLTVVTREE